MKIYVFGIVTSCVILWLILLSQQSAARQFKQHHRVLKDGQKSSIIFNVLSFGAKGDGTTDDTQAFEAAWLAACKLEASTMVVPRGSIFLIKPVSFSGADCQPNLVFQLDGQIVAPEMSRNWKSGLRQWLEFRMMNRMTIRGNGVVDGQGSDWWTVSGIKPTAIRFYGSSEVTVTGITIQNSQQTHLKFNNCKSVQVFGITVSSPGDSPNTDGIHLQNSQDVTIHNTTLACGDDCVSIQTGCSGVTIENVVCGPGHGISIGSLGKDGTTACVSNITVRDTMIHDATNGLRIKTWQGGSGSVQGVTYSNIHVSKVETLIIIDQYYCDGGKCVNKTSAVAVSGVSYKNIRGTYTRNPVRFACSNNSPCIDVTLDTIQLQPIQQDDDLGGPFCLNAYGELKTSTSPPIDCLMLEKASRKQSYGSCQN